MRFYNIVITDPVSGAQLRQYTSLDSAGDTQLGALNVELDCPIYQYAIPMGNDAVRVWGIPLEEIKSASAYNNKIMRVYAGMAKGLPLANPKQQGLILEGMIQQCFGNWVGTDMTLDFVIQYGIGGSPLNPKNIVLNWKAGQTLGDAIKAALAVAAPTIACTTTGSSQLVLDHDQPHTASNMMQLAEWVHQVSKSIMGGSYPGLAIVSKNGQFYIYDDTSPTTPKPIAFQDLIGQPAWLAPNLIQFKTAMRGDINTSDYITLPAGQVTTTAQSYSQFRNGSIMQGTFMVELVRHVGNFRQPDGASWVTIFNAHPSS